MESAEKSKSCQHCLWEQVNGEAGRYRTGKAIVVSVGELVVDEDRVGPVLDAQALLHACGLSLGDLQTWPAVPLERGRLGESAKAGDEAAGGHGEGVAPIVGAFNGDG